MCAEGNGHKEKVMVADYRGIFRYSDTPMPKKTVTYVSHTASRTGAPLFLLHALRAMGTLEWNQNVRMLDTGPLLKDFKNICPTRMIHSGLMNRLRSKKEVPDLYYLHSHSYNFLHQAKRENVPAICHVHEVPLSFEQESEKTIELLKSYPVRCIAVSKFVERMLLSMGIPQQRISYIPSGIDSNYWVRNTDGKGMRSAIGIPSNATVIGMSGTITLLKGVDLWIQMAKELCTKYPERKWHFVWVGSASQYEPEYMTVVLKEVEKLGLSNCIHFVGEHEDPRPYYEMFDIFTLSSRTESLSLVCLENTMMDTPVIAFAGAGGPQEFSDYGFVQLVDSVDPIVMANAVLELVESPTKKAELLDAGEKHIPTMYTLENAAMLMKKEIQNAFHAIDASQDSQ
jgi:glycosyltransferase involved in cell wall biosynthesis